MDVDPVAILSLLSSLTGQVQALQQENSGLRQQLAAAQSDPDQHPA
jgi:hypothetical protein